MFRENQKRSCTNVCRGGSRGGRTRRAPPLKLEKIWFVCVKSWFFTRNTSKMFAPPSAIGKNMIFWRKIVIFHTKYPKYFRASLRSAQLCLCAPPLTWNPGSAPDVGLWLKLNRHVIYEIILENGAVNLWWETNQLETCWCLLESCSQVLFHLKFSRCLKPAILPVSVQVPLWTIRVITCTHQLLMCGLTIRKTIWMTLNKKTDQLFLEVMDVLTRQGTVQNLVVKRQLI